ncbi:PPR10 [Auxenochlorella protothecoides x Auxenochlorella symbiontica]
MRAVPCGRVSCLLPVQGATTCTFVRTAKSGTRTGLHGLPGYRASSSPRLAASTFERLEADFRSTWHEDLLSPELRNVEGGQNTTAPGPNLHNDHLDDLGLEIGATYRQPPKIWQGEVVAHLLSGSFDEAYLSTVPTHTLNWVIKVLGERQQARLALRLLEWMRGRGAANPHTFAKYCEAAGAAGDPGAALAHWRRLLRESPALLASPFVVTALLRAFTRAQDAAGAAAVLAEVQRSGVGEASRFAVGQVMAACMRAGLPGAALAAFRGHRRQALRAGGGEGEGEGARGPHAAPAADAGATPAADTHAGMYMMAVRACALTGRADLLPGLRAGMAQDGIPLDGELGMRFLRAHGGAGQPEEGLAVLREMSEGPTPPNRWHRRALLLEYCEAGSPARVEALAAALEAGHGLRIDARLLTSVLNAFSRVDGGVPAVRAVLRMARRRGVPLRGPLAAAALSCLQYGWPAGARGLVDAGGAACQSSQTETGPPPALGEDSPARSHAPYTNRVGFLRLSRRARPRLPDPAARRWVRRLAEATFARAAPFALRALRRAADARRPQTADARHGALARPPPPPRVPEVGLWNALMAVYMALGDARAVLHTLRRMDADPAWPAPDLGSLNTAAEAAKALGRDAELAELDARAERLARGAPAGRRDGEAAARRAGGGPRRERRPAPSEGSHALGPQARQAAVAHIRAPWE